MMILAFDTTTKHLSVALEVDGKLYKEQNDDFHHAEHLLPLIKKLLQKVERKLTEEDIILVALGPGSFTGIRIGISTALGLQRGSGAELYGINTLRGMRYTSNQELVAPLINARRGNVYTALYNGDKEVIAPYNPKFTDFFERAREASFIGEIEGFEQEGYAFEETKVDSLGLIEAYRRGFYTEEINPIYLREAQAKRRLDAKDTGN